MNDTTAYACTGNVSYVALWLHGWNTLLLYEHTHIGN